MSNVGRADDRWPNRDECEKGDVPTHVTLTEREQQFAGGSKRALKADLIVRLYAGGTYRILKNRRRRSAPFTYETCMLYVSGEDIVVYPQPTDKADGQE